MLRFGEEGVDETLAFFLLSIFSLRLLLLIFSSARLFDEIDPGLGVDHPRTVQD